MEMALPPRPVVSRLGAMFALWMACLMLVYAAGCQKVRPMSDPQLKPIEDMLEAQLPAGTPLPNVLTYLNNRGYAVLPAGKQGTVVTTIRHIDTETLVPVTARVTFYFDANGKLNTYELERAFNEPPPKAEQQETSQPEAQPQQAQPTQP